MQDAAGTWSSFLAAGCLGSRLLIRCCGCDRFALGLIGCSCEALQTQQDARVVQWRHVCRQFYYDHDQIAKRVVEFFESSKLDQIIISADGEGDMSEEDTQVLQLVASLGLRKCVRPEHESLFYDAMLVLEREKNNVRGDFHRHLARRQYDEFEKRAMDLQGTHYRAMMDRKGQPQLVTVVQDGYMRSADTHARRVRCTEEFVLAFSSHVGCQPFFAGLRELLKWNLESPTVVAWHLSDAVFIESGGVAFMDAALTLLVNEWNCSHALSDGSQRSLAAISFSNEVTAKFRLWHIDPYLSDHDLRELLKLMPPTARLQARPTGAKRGTTIERRNIHGRLDENPPFIERWCVIL